MKRKINHLLNVLSFLLIIIFLSFIFLAPSVSALGRPDERVQKPQTRVKLTEGRFRACEAKEKNIKNWLTRLTNMVSNIEEKFDSIATRVEKYYTEKVFPNGKIVSDYDTLVADIQTKKVGVQTALIAAENTANSFTCTGDDPKGQLTQYKENMQNVKSALKEYRTSIKNLIVAVRSVSGNSPTN